jgi:hypothetical protein
VVNDPLIDVISICSPGVTHREVAVAALRAGKHVICEKPLAMTAEEAQEMSQSMRLSWSEQEVDAKLHSIMKNIHDSSAKAADVNGLGYNLLAGANIAGFAKVADAMIAQGII